MFYFTYSMLNLFRTSIHPSSEACDSYIEAPDWSCALASMRVGVSVFLDWSGAGFCLPQGFELLNRY